MNDKEKLQLIPKAERYMQYMIEAINKIPRAEKFGIGNQYNNSMYEMLRNIIYINKLDEKQRVNCLNKIDAELLFQRILLRIMYKNRFIDEKKFNVAIDHISEIGKMLGGMIKFYASQNKKSI